MQREIRICNEKYEYATRNKSMEQMALQKQTMEKKCYYSDEEK